jgi:hypothetical protein
MSSSGKDGRREWFAGHLNFHRKVKKTATDTEVTTRINIGLVAVGVVGATILLITWWLKHR